MMDLDDLSLPKESERLHLPVYPMPPPSERRQLGKKRRKHTPRHSHGLWSAGYDREDPIELLEQQAADRIPELVPIRYGRMLESPFAFFRGAALIMARDLETTPTSGIDVQACGDAHLMNFGVFASPERTMLMDINDFDETMVGPWEWDIKRLAASIEIAGRSRGFDRSFRRDAVLGMAARYRKEMNRYAEMGHLEVWYAKVELKDVLKLISNQESRKAAERLVAKAEQRTSLGALDKMAELVGGRYRIRESPPVVTHLRTSGFEDQLIDFWNQYLDSLPEERRYLLDQYQFVDAARKVVGVGSVGTRANVVLLQGSHNRDPLFLQFKQAQRSVLEHGLRVSPYDHQGQRVVVGQRRTQAASDIFLGWTRAPNGVEFYWRQLRDMKGSVEIPKITRYGFQYYARICGWVLARAHARTGPRVQLAGYLGDGDVFDQAIADFAKVYADQTERDHAALVAAVKSGRVEAITGV